MMITFLKTTASALESDKSPTTPCLLVIAAETAKATTSDGDAASCPAPAINGTRHLFAYKDTRKKVGTKRRTHLFVLKTAGTLAEVTSNISNGIRMNLFRRMCDADNIENCNHGGNDGVEKALLLRCLYETFLKVSTMPFTQLKRSHPAIFNIASASIQFS